MSQSNREVVVTGSRNRRSANGQARRSEPWVTLKVEIVETYDVALIRTEQGERFAHEFIGKQPDGSIHVKCKFWSDVAVDLGKGVGEVVEFHAAYAQKAANPQWGRQFVREGEDRVIWHGELGAEFVELYQVTPGRIDSTDETL